MEIRIATLDDAPELARVHVETWKDTYTGILSESFLKTVSYEKWLRLREENIREANSPNSGKAYLVAKDAEGHIRGFAAGGKNRSPLPGYDAELYAIYVLPGFQREGIGNSLILAMADWLIKQGYNGMCCWILKGNNSKHFYETVGGRLVDTQREMELGGQKYPAVCYGWSDLRALKSLLLF